MKITGLDGEEYNWSPASSQSKVNKKSNLHIKARILLKEVFPYDRILEEVTLAGTGGGIHRARRGVLRADFFIPNRNLIIEAHGEQHFKFNGFFFKDKLSFYRAKARDKDKKEWCRINEIRIIEFNYDEGIDEWRTKVE